jgi:hypothetical protein
VEAVIMEYILNSDEDIDDLIERLRKHENYITDQIVDMLDPHGNTPWKLILKRRQRGRPRVKSSFVARQYYKMLQKHENKRGAKTSIEKVLASRNNMTEAAVRSAYRRLIGTHSRRHKRESGHK